MSYFVGLLFFLGTWGAALGGAWLGVARRLPHLRGTTRFLAWALLATAAVIASVLVPAALGILTRGTALACALGLAAIAWRLPAHSRDGAAGFPPPSRPGSSIDRAIAAVGVGGFAIWLALVALHYDAAAPTGFDTVSAYLPTAARWIQSGSIWHIADWVPGAFYGSGPGNGSMVVASAILPWHDDFVARFAIYPFVALTAVALYALAREMRAPAPAAALMGVMLTSIPVVVQPGLVDALLDPVLYSTFAAGLAFGIRYQRTGAASDLLLAALGLGIAFGTKFYGYTAVAAVVVVWLVARLLARAPARRVARDGAIAGGLILAAGGIWLVRNWIAAGNPLLPLNVHVFGVILFAAPPDPQRYLASTLAGYLGDPSVWTKYLVHQFRIGAALPLVVLGAGVVASAALLVRRRGSAPRADRDGVAVVLVVLAVVLAAVYAVTPYSAPGPPGMPFAAVINVRYGVPAMIAAVGVLGWLAARCRPRWLLVLEAVALAGILDALRVGTTTAPASVWLAFALALAFLVAGALARARIRRTPAPAPRTAAIAAAAVALVAMIAGKALQDRYDDGRYRGVDPAVDWVLDHTRKGAAVGLAGAWTVQGVSPIYPAFGSRLQNRATYLGPAHEGLLRSYSQAAPFRDALRRGRYQVLVLGRSRHIGVPRGQASLFTTRASAAPLGVPPEERWARAAGYREVARSPRFVVMAAQGFAPGASSSARRSLRAIVSNPDSRAQRASGTRGIAGGRPSPTMRRS